MALVRQIRNAKEVPHQQRRERVENLEEWIEQAAEHRKAIAAKSGMPDKNEIFQTLKPNNAFAGQFMLAKHATIQDIGVIENQIIVQTVLGQLVVEFEDKRLTITPHKDGKIIDYHKFTGEKLAEITSYIPLNNGPFSCIFVFLGENEKYEYLIEPKGAQTLEFSLNFNPMEKEDA